MQLVGLVSPLTLLPGHTGAAHLGATWFGVFIGAVTFTGSVVAFAKLKGLVPSKEVSLPLKNIFNTAAFSGSVYAGLAFSEPPSRAPRATPSTRWAPSRRWALSLACI
jgi:NAD/NADP transhydrogenase beta subunit